MGFPCSGGRAGSATLVFAAGLVLLMLATGCSAPPQRGPEFNAAWVVPGNVLQRWHEEKARHGPTFAGSPAWHLHVEFLERELRDRGVRLLPRDPVSYERWFTADDPAAREWSLAVDGRDVPVSGYWAYSGATSDAGVTAPLFLYDGQPATELAGRIVVFPVPALPDPLPPVFRTPPPQYATPDFGAAGIGITQWYQVNYPTRFGRWDNLLRGSAAAGALVIHDLPPVRAGGLYTFPLLSAQLVGVPALHLDREAGALVLAAAHAGRSATLRLNARSEQATPYFLSGVLPGRNFGTPEDELVLLLTHTDGPNLTQENGGLAILAIVDYFAKLEQIERRRSLLVVLDPQHYMPGRHQVDWFAQHPELAARIVASIGVEHIGQREYGGEDGALEPTGRPEATIVYAQDNPRLVEIAVAAIEAEQVPRAEVRVPAREQGQWAGLGNIAMARGIPGFGTSTDMSAYWSTAPGIESFDAGLARRQVGMLVRLTGGFLTEDLDALAVAPREP
jgi:hypothetical protein